MTIFKIIGFISINLLVLFGAHYLLYFSIIRFFSITGPNAQRIVMWIIIFLALSFIPSALLLRLHVNIITSVFYRAASLWLGLFVMILMALIIIWIIFGMGKLAGHIPNMQIISLIFLFLSAFITIYGMWNAFHPEIREIDISIPGLPDHWKNRKIVQLSDVHLGVINGPGFMKRVTEKVNSTEPDLVLITGDLFDGMGGDLSSFIQPLKGIRSKKGVFFVTGNHEGYLGLEKSVSILRKTGIRILENEVVEIEGLQIVGIGFPEFNKANGLQKILEGPNRVDGEKPNILLYHTPTDIGENHKDRGTQQTNTYWTPDTGMITARKAGIDLQLSGHTHAGQFFPFVWIAKCIYKDYNYGLHQDGEFQIYVTSGVGTWGPPLRLGAPPEIVLIRLK